MRVSTGSRPAVRLGLGGTAEQERGDSALPAQREGGYSSQMCQLPQQPEARESGSH